MENKNKVLLTVIGALTFIAVLVGATFAYFSATSTTNSVNVTTSNLNLNVEANGAATHVTNIKPTTWDDETLANNDDNVDIAKIPFKVTGTSSVQGTYTVNLKTSIALNDSLTGGDVSDIKYRLFDSEGEEIGTEGSFAASTDVNILEDITIDGSGAILDEYVLYVYISDNSAEQNKLQDIDFTISLGGSAQQL